MSGAMSSDGPTGDAAPAGERPDEQDEPDEPGRSNGSSPTDSEAPSGGPLLAINAFGTALFVVVTIAAILALEAVGRVMALLSLVLFGLGSLAFLAGFWHAVQRSRIDEISLGGMLLFTHQGAPPKGVRSAFLRLLAVQSVVALVGASLKPFTELAFGILAPMFALGLGCLWGARHGRFPKRST